VEPDHSGGSKPVPDDGTVSDDGGPDDGTVSDNGSTVMQRNVAVKHPGPGGIKLTPAAPPTSGSGPAAIGPATAIGPAAANGSADTSPASTATGSSSSPRRIAYDDDGGTNGHKALSIGPAKRHQRAQGPPHQVQRRSAPRGDRPSGTINGHTALSNIPLWLAYDDDGGPIERKARIPRRLAYDDDGGTNGRKALTNKLIVRTQKRLEDPQVGLRLDNEASRDSDSSSSHISVISCTPRPIRQLKGGDDVISKTPMFTDRHTLTISTPNLF